MFTLCDNKHYDNLKSHDVCIRKVPETFSVSLFSLVLMYCCHRDGGLPASRFFAKVHPRLDLPLNALYLTTALVVIFGCIFLGSSRLVSIVTKDSHVTKCLKCFQCHHFRICRRARCLLRYSCRYQLPPGKEDASGKTFRAP
jgi:hypothetical protein